MCDGQVSVDGENRLRFNKHTIRIKIKSFETVSVWLIRPHLLICGLRPFQNGESFIIMLHRFHISHIASLIIIYLVPLQITHSHIRLIVCRLFGQPFDTFFLYPFFGAEFDCLRSCLKIVMTPLESHRMSGGFCITFGSKFDFDERKKGNNAKCRGWEALYSKSRQFVVVVGSSGGGDAT